MELILIAAVAQNNVIGKDGQVPWRIPEDLKRFKEGTLHHSVIMGRKTYESIPAKYRPLPQRVNIILTRQPEYRADGAFVMSSLEEALQAVQRSEPVMEGIKYDEAFVIGGESVYRKALPFAVQLQITQVHAPYEGDVHFPEIDPAIWRETACRKREGYSFVTYQKK